MGHLWNLKRKKMYRKGRFEMFNNRLMKTILFGAIFASIVSIFMSMRKRHTPVIEMPMNSLRRGSRMIQAGTRSAVRSAKHGLRVLNR